MGAAIIITVTAVPQSSKSTVLCWCVTPSYLFYISSMTSYPTAIVLEAAWIFELHYSLPSITMFYKRHDASQVRVPINALIYT
jgi:hypothetical protein